MRARAVIAYWGPGLSGKSTNLAVVNEVIAKRGGAEQDRRVAFGAEPVLLHLGSEGEVFELVAPPGQGHHRLLRQDLFGRVDGVIFVADSSASAVGVNLAALEELELLVAARHQELSELPLVFQFNKRDLCDALDLSRLQELLNPSGRPSLEAIATRGVGVFPALKLVAGELKRSGRKRRAELVGDSDSSGSACAAEAGGPEESLIGQTSPGVSAFGGLTARDGGPITARALALACLVGALLRELIELGWRLSGGGE